MLWVSSLRRIARSTSLRATGSWIDFCRSAACVVLPLRAAAIASFKAAISVADGKSLGARVDRTERTGVWRAASGMRGVMPAFAGAFSGRGLGSGTLPAGEVASAMARPPPARRPVKNRVGVCTLKSSPLIVPAAILIPADHHPRPRQKGGGDTAGGFLRSRLPVNNDASLDAALRPWASQWALTLGQSARPPKRLRGSCHDCQDELPRLVYRARHPFRQRCARRESLSRSGGLADRRGYQRLGPGRHHRREPDAIARGARAGGRVVRGAGEGPRSRDRGCRL